MAKDTLASLRAEIDRLSALVASPVAPSAASGHWRARDLACTVKGCTFTGRTAKGLAFHVARTDPKAHVAK